MSLDLDKLKTGLQVVYGFVFLVLIVSMFPNISHASKILLDRAASTSSLEVGGIKVAFTAATVRYGLTLDDVPEPEQKPVLEAIQALGSQAFIRLMAIGRVNDSCEYDFPTPGMRNDVALDYDLEAKGLVQIVPSEAILEATRASRAKEVAKGKRWTIGAPRACYALSLTDKGSRVKTVIVKNLAPAFNSLVPDGTTTVATLAAMN